MIIKLVAAVLSLSAMQASACGWGEPVFIGEYGPYHEYIPCGSGIISGPVYYEHPQPVYLTYPEPVVHISRDKAPNFSLSQNVPARDLSFTRGGMVRYQHGSGFTKIWVYDGDKVVDRRLFHGHFSDRMVTSIVEQDYGLKYIPNSALTTTFKTQEGAVAANDTNTKVPAVKASNNSRTVSENSSSTLNTLPDQTFTPRPVPVPEDPSDVEPQVRFDDK